MRAKLSMLLICFGLAASSATAREQWQMNHPTAAPPTQPTMPIGMVPKTPPQDFWKGQIANRIPAGTVLTGILQQDLASHKTQRGEIFEILLQDGFAMNGNLLLPPHTKIMGTVISALPAAMLKHGNPGRLQVALHQLVFPTGQTTPFYGFIDENVCMDRQKEQKAEGPGHKFKDWGKSLSAFGNQFTGGIGSQMARRHMGRDFKLDKGEVLPVRLNRSIDIPPGVAQPIGPNGSPIHPSAAGAAVPPGYPTVPQAIGASPYGPRQAYGAPPGVPGLAAPDYERAPAPLPDDANSVFSTPVNPRPLQDLPDPF